MCMFDQMVQTYLLNTHAKTHGTYTLSLVDLFTVKREGEEERFQKHAEDANRKLLWHGSRLTNWCGILSQVMSILFSKSYTSSPEYLDHIHRQTLLWLSIHVCSALSTSPYMQHLYHYHIHVWLYVVVRFHTYTQGLRIAPKEAPVTGYMFGKGVYFADMSSKSANYCFGRRVKHDYKCANQNGYIL